MTNNEAIGILAIVVETAKGRCFVTDEAISDAYAMAISALQAQPTQTNTPNTLETLDCVERQKAIDVLMEFDKKLRKINWYQYPHTEYECRGVDEAIVKIANLPSTSPEPLVKESRPLVKDLVKDAISRQAAIDRINKQREHLQPDIYPQDKIGDAAYRICAEFIERLPSAQPEIEERTEEFAQNVPKEDLISRKAAIEALVKAIRKDPYYDSNEAINGLGVCDVRVILNDLPSAQPERKKGKWTVKKGELLSLDECSVCRKIVIHRAPHYNFCPNCGADMREDQHDQSK